MKTFTPSKAVCRRISRALAGPIPLLLLSHRLRAQVVATFNQVADTTTPIPGGTGNFTDYPPDPCIDNGKVAFGGDGAFGQQGVYLFHPTDPVLPVADKKTAIPGGTGNFTAFPNNPTISGQNVAFLGLGAFGQQGVYRFHPGDPVLPVADLNTPIPNGTGNFTAFVTDAAISGGNVVFVGSGASGQQGVYRFSPGDPVLPVADTKTAIPGGSGNFTTFHPTDPILPGAPGFSGNNIAFFGAGAADAEGIYIFHPPDPVQPVADRNTLMPGGTGNFQFFTALALVGNHVAFVAGRNATANPGSAFDEEGVYKAINVVAANPPLIKVADLNTAVPGGVGTFTGFGNVSIDSGIVVFEGFSFTSETTPPATGLYTDFGGTLAKIIATGDTLGGKVVNDLRFGWRGFSKGQVVFAADFTDDTHAVFMATFCSLGFAGFHPPIGGGGRYRGTYANPVRACKLKSTVPVKMTLTTCDRRPLTTGVHTLQVIKFRSATTFDPPIDATATDAATTGNQFRLTDAAAGEWHFNLSTKGLSKGIWQIKATLSDGSVHTAFIELK